MATELIPSRAAYLAILRNREGKTVKQVKITLPTSVDKDWSRQLTSWSAFQNRERARANSALQAFYCTFTDWDWALNGLKIVDPNCEQVTTVWALYKLIGYDYKTQEYV